MGVARDGRGIKGSRGGILVPQRLGERLLRKWKVV